LYPFLRNLQIYNLSVDDVYLDEVGIPVADFDIMDWAVFPNKSSAGKEDKYELNYYKPGDFLISGIISTSGTIFKPYVFFKPPNHRFQSNTKAKSIVCQLDSEATLTLAVLIRDIDKEINLFGGKVWIATALSDINVRLFYQLVNLQHNHLLLSFSTQAKKRTQYYDFNSHYSATRKFGEAAFQCSYSIPLLSKKVWNTCLEKESWETPPQDLVERIQSEDGSSISTTIQVVAWVLRAAFSSQRRKRRMTAGDHQKLQMLHPFLRNFQIYNLSVDDVYLDEAGIPVADFDIMDWAVFPNKSSAGVKIGNIENEGVSSDIKFSIDENAIIWPSSFNQEQKFNYYKPGDFLISGIISTSSAAFKPYIFFKPPNHRFLSNTKAKCIVCQLDSQTTLMLVMLIQNIDKSKILFREKVWIATALSDISVRLFYQLVNLQHSYLLLSFSTQAKKRTQYYNFYSHYSAIGMFGEAAFQCSYSIPFLSKKVLKRCLEKETWETPSQDLVERILTMDGSSISTAIQAVAWVLRATFSSQRSQRRMRVGDHQQPHIIQPWQVRLQLQNATNGFLSILKYYVR
ncbi:hypothetical protein E2320_014573, partial [Naja naja]